jgi:hypothetical protein
LGRLALTSDTFEICAVRGFCFMKASLFKVLSGNRVHNFFKNASLIFSPSRIMYRCTGVLLF